MACPNCKRGFNTEAKRLQTFRKNMKGRVKSSSLSFVKTSHVVSGKSLQPQVSNLPSRNDEARPHLPHKGVVNFF